MLVRRGAGNVDCAGTLEGTMNVSAAFAKAAGKTDGIC